MELGKTVFVNGISTPQTKEALVAAGINEKDAALAIEFLQKAEERDGNLSENQVQENLFPEENEKLVTKIYAKLENNTHKESGSYYQKLSEKESRLIREDYLRRLSLPLKGNPDTVFYTSSNMPIAKGYNRVVVGDYGPYVEFLPSQINQEKVVNKFKGEPTRPLKYIWKITTDTTQTKVYEQLNTVSYADYKKGMFYIDPADLKTLSQEKLYQPYEMGKTLQEAPPWARYAPNGYEVSSHGDRRFSALNARLKDGRTIEEAYQLDVKGYRSQSNNWRAGKGKPPISPISKEELYQKYLSLWRQWGKENPVLLMTLKEKAAGKTLTDKFAITPITQARALADLLKEIQPMSEKEIQSIVESEKPIVAKAKEVMSRNTPSDAVDVLTRCYKGRPENVIEAKRWATNLVKATLSREIQLEGHNR